VVGTLSHLPWQSPANVHCVYCSGLEIKTILVQVLRGVNTMPYWVPSFRREPEFRRLPGKGRGPVFLSWTPAFAGETAGRDARPTM